MYVCVYSLGPRMANVIHSSTSQGMGIHVCIAICYLQLDIIYIQLTFHSLKRFLLGGL